MLYKTKDLQVAKSVHPLVICPNVPSSCHEYFLQSVAICQETVLVRMECRQRVYLVSITLSQTIDLYRKSIL